MTYLGWYIRIFSGNVFRISLQYMRVRFIIVLILCMNEVENGKT